VRWLDHLLHPNQEWDSYTGSWVRAGWVAERQAIMNRALESHQAGNGRCIECGELIDDHPMPERMWRSGPDLCARVGEAQ
jgi:hypothetical protein